MRENDLEKLQAGECECLCLCKNLKVVTLLTDDLAARDAAKRLGITRLALWALSSERIEIDEFRWKRQSVISRLLIRRVAFL